MSDKRMYTQLDLVRAQREAFRAGVVCERSGPSSGTVVWTVTRDSLYPLPKVKRPRVVQDVERYWEFRVIDGKVQCRWNGGGGFNAEWGPINRTVEAIEVTRTRCDIWAELLANPTEEVEAES